MASRYHNQESSPPLPLDEGVAQRIPRRATRNLPAIQSSMLNSAANTVETKLSGPLNQSLANPDQFEAARKKMPPPRRQIATDTPPPWYLAILFRHRGAVTIGYNRTNGRWPQAWVWALCLIVVICFLAIPLSVGIVQRSVSISVSTGQVYSMQVGGKQANSWQHDPQPNVPAQSGPYAVLGNPSISVDFINQVLSTYNSPAAGKGQSLYDLGKQYGIDPVFALAFFMHESSFGTQGEAAKSLSLGNLRCIPNFRCADNFAQFDTWEDGFKAWYQLIRNLYVAQWELTTIDQVIPRYAPSSDNNNVEGYIAALKHSIDTWHAGQTIVK